MNLRVLTVALLGIAAAPRLRAEEAPPAPAMAQAPGFLGLDTEAAASLDAARQTRLGISATSGTYIAVLVPGGPAEQAGARRGDRLVRFDGKGVPEHPAAEVATEETHQAWRKATRALTETLCAGQKVEMVLEREGATRTVAATAISAEAFHALQAHGAPSRNLPPLADAGPATPQTIDFEAAGAVEGLPPTLYPWEGRWSLAPAGSGKQFKRFRLLNPPQGAAPQPVPPPAPPPVPVAGAAGRALRQSAPTLPWAVLLAAGPGLAMADGAVRVRFCSVSGVADASGGLILRAQDPRNHYIARANALEDNLRIYLVRDGVRTQLATTKTPPFPLGTWHDLAFEASGSTLRVTLDGTHSVEAKDETFRSGWVGLWTKADSVTDFESLRIESAR